MAQIPHNIRHKQIIHLGFYILCSNILRANLDSTISCQNARTFRQVHLDSLVIMNLVDLHNRIPNPTNFIVDIGASVGVASDPVYPFISGANRGYKGLCIEGSAEKTRQLASKTSFHICNQFINPTNIIGIFESYEVPIDLDVLKIDIDGYDLEVLRTILSVYKPKIIVAEINEKIPPPILFEIKYTPDYAWDESHAFGFSIQSGEQFMSSAGYKIVEIFDYGNIICVHSDFCKTLGVDNAPSIQDLYKTQYVDVVKSGKGLPWNANVNYWLDIQDPEILKDTITNYFCKVNDRSKFQVKTKKLDVDFSIGLA